MASDQFDAVVDYGLMPFDLLPLIGVIEAAGGMITDWYGAPLNYGSDGRFVSAATPKLNKVG